MKKITKLADIKSASLWHGNILRMPAKWPYEDVVDLMVFDAQDEHTPYGLIVTSGQKAGLILVHLPPESVQAIGGGVSVEWVISNWSKWIYPDCDVKEVYVIDRYVAG
ncbi:Imm45 family immunity protein [Cupriavidus sp. 8B]